MKEQDVIRKLIVNKRRNEETCEVKNENIENILMKGNETAQKVKPNLVSGVIRRITWAYLSQDNGPKCVAMDPMVEM
ncbi:59_t:CDS:2 [Racocetra fulgida]|uniref:59_t:CDS:1 n=2 Tax=Racocetra fulgida TaxID=60492 RepID=A0A9N8YXI3_9GLOM|nr:59_t:CDS:2 [Racocetra fulgida]